MNIVRKSLLATLHYLHLAIVLFFVTAWAIPSATAWFIHVITAPIMVLQWKFNKDMCIITNIENLIRGESFYPEDGGEGQFLKKLYMSIFKKEPSDTLLLFITYGILIVSCSLSLLRLIVSGEL